MLTVDTSQLSDEQGALVDDVVAALEGLRAALDALHEDHRAVMRDIVVATLQDLQLGPCRHPSCASGRVGDKACPECGPRPETPCETCSGRGWFAQFAPSTTAVPTCARVVCGTCEGRGS